MGEPSACMDFEAHLRQIDLWEPGEPVVPPCAQAGRLLERIKSRERERVTTLDLFYRTAALVGKLAAVRW